MPMDCVSVDFQLQSNYYENKYFLNRSYDANDIIFTMKKDKKNIKKRDEFV